MRKLLIAMILTSFGWLMQAQVIAVKTNLLYDATTTPNLGVEYAFNRHFSIEAAGSYNPWKFANNKSLEHWAVQPEARYWLHERFNGHYFGVHGIYMDYKIKGMHIPSIMSKTNDYNGNAYGGGISYGYQLYLSPRWNLEFTVGGGFLYFEYDKYAHTPEHEYLGKYNSKYVGLTKAGINLIYIIK